MHDVFFISYGEETAETNWERLVDIHPLTRRVMDIDGIFNAHSECARRSRTSHFFVVDADSEVHDAAIFQFKPPEWDANYVHVWFARNPLLAVPYGWGGLKLFPRHLFDDVAPGLDMTTSFPLKVVPEVVSTTHFNITAFETWRAAFRESVKLSLNDNDESRERLAAWLNPKWGAHRGWCVAGARGGISYVEAGGDPKNINDYRWLEDHFKATDGSA